MCRCDEVVRQHGFCCDITSSEMASEAIVQLRTHTERSVCHNVVHSTARVLPGCGPSPWKASWIPSDVGPGGRCCCYTSDRLRVRSDQRVLSFAKEKELASIRFIVCLLTLCHITKYKWALYEWNYYYHLCDHRHRIIDHRPVITVKGSSVFTVG